MYWGTLKNHVISALKHMLWVIVRTASMKKKIIIRKLTVFCLKSLYFQDMKISFCVFHICSSQRFVPLMSFQVYTQTFEMEGADV